MEESKEQDIDLPKLKNEMEKTIRLINEEGESSGKNRAINIHLCRILELILTRKEIQLLTIMKEE